MWQLRSGRISSFKEVVFSTHPSEPMRNTVGIREVRADGTVLPGAMSLDVAGGGVTIEHVEASGGQPAKYLLTVPKRTFRRSRRLRLPLTKRPRLRGRRARRAVQNKYVTNADSRMTNARTPTSHASSHVGGGSDAIAVATSTPAASPVCFRPHGQRF